ncbi:unnamed protein product [Symbiodinium natans]|uniref:Uncharacterized protein n=1 Tax=Symbiodinium natans TaxID=878477 RepID=A0A812NBY7_9DINO|nr:unnamed protein product [Symbiodinium natans]
MVAPGPQIAGATMSRGIGHGVTGPAVARAGRQSKQVMGLEAQQTVRLTTRMSTPARLANIVAADLPHHLASAWSREVWQCMQPMYVEKDSGSSSDQVSNENEQLRRALAQAEERQAEFASEALEAWQQLHQVMHWKELEAQAKAEAKQAAFEAEMRAAQEAFEVTRARHQKFKNRVERNRQAQRDHKARQKAGLTLKPRGRNGQPPAIMAVGFVNDAEASSAASPAAPATQAAPDLPLQELQTADQEEAGGDQPAE